MAQGTTDWRGDPKNLASRPIILNRPFRSVADLGYAFRGTPWRNIDFANPELKLFPGMTAYVSIPVATADNVLKVPDAALRYKPSMSPEEVHELYRKYGIDDGSSGAGAAETEASRSRGREHKPANGSAQGRSAAPASDSAGGMAIVWKLEGSDAIRTVEIALGITDHAFTAVTSILKGELKEGDQVVTRSVSSKAMAPTGQGIRR